MNVKVKKEFDIRSAICVILFGIVVYDIFIVIPLLVLPVFLKIFSFAILLFILFTTCRFLLSLYAVRLVHPPKRHLNELPFVSIVVPAYEEASVLPRTIESMLKVNYPKDRIEFIYVYEDKSTDETAQIIHAYASMDERIRPVKKLSRNGGKAAAANYGIQNARGEIIGSFDADHSISPDAVLRAVEWFQDPQIVCVKGRCRGINKQDGFLAMVVGIERDIVEGLCIPSAFFLGGFSTFGGGQAFFRKSIFSDLGYFDENIMTEDIDYSVKLHLQGHRVVCDPTIISWEEHPKYFVTWWQQRKRWARGWMLVLAKHLGDIIRSKTLKRYEKLDMIMSLTTSLAPVVTINIIPLMLLTSLGKISTVAPFLFHLFVIVFATLLPILLAFVIIWFDNRNEKIFRRKEMLYSFALWPYFFILIIVGWVAFVEEFVLRKESEYVKTRRNNLTDNLVNTKCSRFSPIAPTPHSYNEEILPGHAAPK